MRTFCLLRPSGGEHHRRQPLRAPYLEAQACLFAVQPPENDRGLFVHTWENENQEVGGREVSFLVGRTRGERGRSLPAKHLEHHFCSAMPRDTGITPSQTTRVLI